MTVNSQALQPRLTLVASSDPPRNRSGTQTDPFAFLQAITLSLDLERVLNVLDDFIQEVVEHSGWEYRPAEEEPALDPDDREPLIRGGRPDRHRLEYALSFEGGDMGTLLFMRGRRFSDEDQRRIEHLLGLAAPTLRNALKLRRLARQLECDVLTGLGNRRAFHLQGAQWLADCIRHERPFSMLALDLDGFKTVNDRFGHRAGDALLRAVAAALKKATRASDLCVRMGGDEFVAVMPGASLLDAMRCGERVRLAIASLSVPLDDGTRIGASASVGVATHGAGIDLDELYHRADMALYAAKRAGSNQVLAGGDCSGRPAGMAMSA